MTAITESVYEALGAMEARIQKHRGAATRLKTAIIKDMIACGLLKDGLPRKLQMIHAGMVIYALRSEEGAMHRVRSTLNLIEERRKRRQQYEEEQNK